MIIAFYSFKGGVGRTMTAVNVGMQLALEGKNVGIVDLDIEAPGVITNLGLEPTRDGGLLHIMTGGNVPFLEKVVIDVLEKKKDSIPQSRHKSTKTGKLYVLPSTPDPQLIDQVRWDNPTTNWMLLEIIKYFRTKFKLDYVLLDSRSGLAISSSYALALSDRVICFFRLNQQNIMGAKQLLPSFQATGRDYQVVLSLVPDVPEKIEWIKRFERETNMRINLELPFENDLLFEEKLYVITNPDSPLTAATKLLVQQIIK